MKIRSKGLCKALLLIAVLVLCLTVVSVEADAAASGTCGDNLFWELNEWDALYIYGSGDMYDYSPENSAPWAEYLPEGQLSVSISGDVTSVGAYAFYGYPGALFVHLEDSAVMSIGPYAFYDCQNLFELYLPESVFTIGEYAFYQCTSLQAVQQLNLLNSIGSYSFYGCYSLTELPIGSSLSTIGDYAFSECGSLDTVTFPASVTYIGDGAFAYSSLRTVTFEGNAPQIYQSSFDGTTIDAYYDPNTEGWADILSQYFYGDISWYTIGGSESPVLGTGTCGDGLTWELTQDGVMTISGTGRMTEFLGFDPPWLDLKGYITSVVIESGVTYIGRNAFVDCTNLTDITVADTVVCIGTYAFDGTSWLDSQPDGLVYIGKVVYTYKGTCPATVHIAEDTTGIAAMAFQEETQLQTINFPASLREIGGWAFLKCDSLKAAPFNEGLQSIGTSAFGNCVTLTEIILPDSLTSVGMNVFTGCEQVEKVVIGDGLTSLEYATFSFCTALKEIDFGNGLQQISIAAFSNCTALESISLPDNIRRVLDKAFQQCTALKTVHLGKVNSIDYQAFSNCIALESITLPQTLTYIGVSAFSFCRSLKSVSVPDSVTMMDGGCFSSCDSMTYAYIGKGVTQLDSQAFLNNTALEFITVDPENAYYMNDAYGVVYTKDQKTLVTYPAGRVGDYTVAATVTKIARTAIANCPGLWGITLPEGLLTLEYGALAECTALKEVSLPDSLANTSGGTFLGCTALETVHFGDGLTDLSATMFQDCTALKNVHLPETLESIGSDAFKNCTSLVEITIPDAVTEIWNYAFLDCTGLSSLTLPKSLVSIRGGAFYNCRSLQEVYLPDSVTSIDYSAFESCIALETVVLPKNLKYIDDNVFSVCLGLKTIVIPESVEKIDIYAFSGCLNMETIKFTGSQEQWEAISIGNGAIPSWIQIVYDYERYGKVEDWNVTLKDNIGASFNLSLSEEILADVDAYVTLSFDGRSERIPAAQAAEGIAVDMAAAQMTKPIGIRIFFRHGSSSEEYVYTVKQYGEYILQGDYSEADKIMAAALLNYGGKAQKYFAYHTGDLADENVSVEEQTVPEQVDTQLSISGGVDGLTFYGATMLFRNKLAVRYYFKAEQLSSQVQFKLGDVEVTPVHKDGMYYVEAGDILPQDLDQSITLTVSDGQNQLQLMYSPMNYIVRMYQKGSDDLKLLLQALYTYHIAAKNYSII